MCLHAAHLPFSIIIVRSVGVWWWESLAEFADIFLADARVIESLGDSQMFFRTNKLCEIREQKACGDPCQYLLGHRRINTNAEPIPPLRGTEGAGDLCKRIIAACVGFAFFTI